MTAKTEFLRKPKACVYHAYVIMYACDKIQKGVLIMKRTVLCLVLIICTLVLCACNAVEFELYFMVDGEVYGNVKTGGREMIRIPDDPVKEGYTFDGWYWDKDVWQRPFTANSLLDAPLSSNMSVYAKWTDNTAPDEDDTPPEAVLLYLFIFSNVNTLLFTIFSSLSSLITPLIDNLYVHSVILR